MSKKTPDVEQCPSVWFTRLERAKNLNDFEAAAAAERKLRELGVTVKFARPPKREASSCQ
jgi:hypothetical protein